MQAKEITKILLLLYFVNYMVEEIERKIQISYVSYPKLEPVQWTKVPRKNIGEYVLPFFF